MALLRLGTPEDRLHARDELARRERLRQVVVCADLEADDAIRLLVASGEHQDRHLRPARASHGRRRSRPCRAARCRGRPASPGGARPRRALPRRSAPTRRGSRSSAGSRGRAPRPTARPRPGGSFQPCSGLCAEHESDPDGCAVVDPHRDRPQAAPERRAECRRSAVRCDPRLRRERDRSRWCRPAREASAGPAVDLAMRPWSRIIVCHLPLICTLQLVVRPHAGDRSGTAAEASRPSRPTARSPARRRRRRPQAWQSGSQRISAWSHT